MTEEIEFGTGWKPDQGLARLAPMARVRSLARAGDALARDKPSSHLIAEPQIMLQGRSSACSAFGVWLAAEMWDRKRQSVLRGAPSPWFAYQAACWLEAGGVDAKMRDDGCSVATIEKAYEKFGMVPLSEWGPSQGITPLNPIERPPQLVRMRAQKVELELGRIFDRGESLLERVLDSLALDQPCPLALGIGKNWNRGVADVIDLPEKVTTYHLVYAYGYRGYPDRPEIRIANSWGKAWRQDGSAWLTGSVVARAEAAWFVKGVHVKELPP